MRTDCHRPAEIVPADYEYIMSYNLSTQMDGWPVPSHGINCEMDGRHKDENDNYINGTHGTSGECCIIGLNHIKKVTWGGNGGTGKCSVCGTRFVYGDVWKHIPSGEYIHVGHQCASKYGLLADRSAWDMQFNHLKAETARQIQRKINDERREAFLEEHPTVKADLELEHPIINDMKKNFISWCGLTEKQLVLLKKIADEMRDPNKETEIMVSAPEGKQTFTGEVVSVKLKSGYYGDTWKITVKVKEDAGVWIAWGTCPKALIKAYQGQAEALKGDTVEIKANLTRSDDKEHFAFFNRPSGKIIEKSE